MSGAGESGSFIETPNKQRTQSRILKPASSSTPKSVPNGKDYGCEPAAEFGDLNSRFAAIVERNSAAVTENTELKSQLETKDLDHLTELSKVKKMYEDELKEARRLLDKAANEKVQLEMAMQQTRDKNKELIEKANQSSLNEKTATDLAEKLQKNLDSKEASLATAKRDAQNATNEKAELTMQLTAAKSALDAATKEKEKSVLEFHQQANLVQSIREDLQMKERIHAEEMNNSKKLASESLSRSLADQSSVHNATMANALEDIRQEHESSLAAKVDVIKKQYETKMQDLEEKLKKQNGVAKSKAGEISKQKALNDNLTNQLKRCEKDLANARDELRRAESKCASQKGMADSAIEECTTENEDLKKKIGALEQKIMVGTEKYSTLTNELNTYRSLLEVEENRHNITPSPIRNKKRSRSQVGSSTLSPPKKTKTSLHETVEDVGQDSATGPADSSCRIM